MEKGFGNKGIEYSCCINPMRNVWAVRWNMQDKNDIVEFMEERFDHKPTIEEIKGVIYNWYNSIIQDRIISGFKWKDMLVWLSTENQLNYKTIYDRVVESLGKILPLTLKFGSDTEPIYHEFTTVEEFADFYHGVTEHIHSCLNNGWECKKNIDFSVYEL